VSGLAGVAQLTYSRAEILRRHRGAEVHCAAMLSGGKPVWNVLVKEGGAEYQYTLPRAEGVAA
jgi:uncharacterized metal-binding protein